MKKLINRVDWYAFAAILVVAICSVILSAVGVIAIIDVAIGVCLKDFAIFAILIFALAISWMIIELRNDLKEDD